MTAKHNIQSIPPSLHACLDSYYNPLLRAQLSILLELDGSAESWPIEPHIAVEIDDLARPDDNKNISIEHWE